MVPDSTGDVCKYEDVLKLLPTDALQKLEEKYEAEMERLRGYDAMFKAIGQAVRTSINEPDGT